MSHRLNLVGGSFARNLVCFLAFLKNIFIIYFFWPQIIFLPQAKAQIFKFRSMKMCNELQHIVPLSAIFAIGQRDTNHRISKCPTVILQSGGSRVERVMKPNATKCNVGGAEVIKF